MPPKKSQQGSTTAKSTKRKAPAKTSKKRYLTPDDIPEYDRNITTQAARDRKRFKLSRASIYQDFDNIESITDLAQKLQGESVYSWGIPKSEPIQASRKRKTKSRTTKTSVEERYLQIMEDMRPKRGPPNCPHRCPILRIPLEIREKIYSYLLIHERPIIVKEDWITVERNPFQSHAIIQTCRQFAEEASRFVYKSNVFKAVLRNPTTIFRRREDPIELYPKYHSLFRNITIDCSVHSKSIQSLILVLVPRRVGITTTALGIELNPIAYADFLWYDGALMTAIRHLSPKKLQVVIKKSDKRLLISIDMMYYQAGLGLEETPLANSETIRLAQAKATIVDKELLGLKNRFEEIFEDDEGGALQDGRCLLLEDGEGTASIFGG
ncbi:hypothetical protein BGZ57DRAFT_962412 [Hyaloscypha finlandica]|nr:hypothetical protein BGZ57DRAFT_962412 [Hyaloscypha finlandica]